MAESISWEDLLAIYENTTWDKEPQQIYVANESILETLLQLAKSDKAAFDAGILVLVDADRVRLMASVPAEVGPPKLQLGVLADSLDGMLTNPGSRIRRPEKFYLKATKTHSGTAPEPIEIAQYNSMISFVGALETAALFLDGTKQMLVFYSDRRIEVPVTYVASDLQKLDTAEVEKLCHLLDGEIHRDQRATILSEALTGLVDNLPRDKRFQHLLRNLTEINIRLSEGYKLFASSFSYTKIRNQVEAAQAEYISKIHKTFTDIQGQLLGLPIASVVVASQLKVTEECGPTSWGNVAVLMGAWLFVLLLLASCINQWLTLRSISEEISSQKRKVKENFSEIEGIFDKKFKTLATRLIWHRSVLVIVAFVAIAGAWFATSIFRKVNQVAMMHCVP